MTPWDAEVLARTLYGESRGESDAGKQAVAWVIRNRTMDAQKRWPAGLAAACLQAKQLSCWNEGDPNRGILPLLNLYDPMFARCMGIAWAVAGGLLPDNTGPGANHYLVATLTHKPAWFDETKITARIGAHEFLKL